MVLNYFGRGAANRRASAEPTGRKKDGVQLPALNGQEGARRLQQFRNSVTGNNPLMPNLLQHYDGQNAGGARAGSKESVGSKRRVSAFTLDPRLPNVGGDDQLPFARTFSMPSTMVLSADISPERQRLYIPDVRGRRNFLARFTKEGTTVDRQFLNLDRYFGFETRQPNSSDNNSDTQDSPNINSAANQTTEALYGGKLINEIAIAVKQPEDVSFPLWVANNFIKIFKELNMVSAFMMHGCCTEKTCPAMKAGTHSYLWEDENGKSIVLSAPRYIQCVLDQAQKMINNPRIFPNRSGVEFPSNFVDAIAPVMRRMFRMYCHFYRHHLLQMEELNVEKRVRFCAAFCTMFMLEHHLCSSVEYDTIRPIVDQWLSECTVPMGKNNVIFSECGPEGVKEYWKGLPDADAAPGKNTQMEVIFKSPGGTQRTSMVADTKKAMQAAAN